jgi:hypothetical protein
MTVHNFKWYLHEDSDTEGIADELMRQGLPEGVADKLAAARPFYEVEFDCTYDDETGAFEYQAGKLIRH